MGKKECKQGFSPDAAKSFKGANLCLNRKANLKSRLTTARLAAK
jgi:hypothetical protein